MQPTLSDPVVKLIPVSEIVDMMKYMGIMFAVICFFALILSLIRAKQKRMVKPQGKKMIFSKGIFSDLLLWYDERMD